jgi:hypothetical protein
VDARGRGFERLATLLDHGFDGDELRQRRPALGLERRGLDLDLDLDLDLLDLDLDLVLKRLKWMLQADAPL